MVALMYHKPAGCTPLQRCLPRSRLCRCRRLHLSSQRWRSAAGGPLTKSSAVGLTLAQNLEHAQITDYRYDVQTNHRHNIQLSYNVHVAHFFSSHGTLSLTKTHTLTILPPGKAGGRYATGLTHQSGETSFNHSQRRNLL